MTLTVRALAQLFHPITRDLLASGIAVIWNDLHDWGGIFEPHEYADELRAAVADQPLTAQIETLDGRRATVTLTPSIFVADGLRPLTFRGQGAIDTTTTGGGGLEGAAAPSKPPPPPATVSRG